MLNKSTKILMFSFLTFVMVCLLCVVIYDFNMGGFKENISVFYEIIALCSGVIGFSVFQLIRTIRRKE